MLNRKNTKIRLPVKNKKILAISTYNRRNISSKIITNSSHLKYLELLILYENNHYIIINKPCGMCVHQGSYTNTGLIEKLKILRPYTKKLELVHRIDKETSGCLIVAKKYNTLVKFHNMIKDHQIDKVYHTVVHGMWPREIKKIKATCQIFNFFGGRKVAKIDKKRKEAFSKISVLKYMHNITCLQVSTYTGRMHQIRIHLTLKNHPIVSDKKHRKDKYGSYSAKYKHLFLHARHLQFHDPENGNLITCTAPYDQAYNNIVSRKHSLELKKAQNF